MKSQIISFTGFQAHCLSSLLGPDSCLTSIEFSIGACNAKSDDVREPITEVLHIVFCVRAGVNFQIWIYEDDASIIGNDIDIRIEKFDYSNENDILMELLKNIEVIIKSR